MKKFLAILILIFTLQTPSQADDIRDFQIEGMSIGDSLLDYFSEEEIKNNSKPKYYDFIPNFPFIAIEIEKHNSFEQYYGVQFHVKKNDNAVWNKISEKMGPLKSDYKSQEAYLSVVENEIRIFENAWLNGELFKNIPSDALVIAASFGDSIGRGEFSNKHLLYLNHKQPNNTLSLNWKMLFL